MVSNSTPNFQGGSTASGSSAAAENTSSPTFGNRFTFPRQIQIPDSISLARNARKSGLNLGALFGGAGAALTVSIATILGVKAHRSGSISKLFTGDFYRNMNVKNFFTFKWGKFFEKAEAPKAPPGEDAAAQAEKLKQEQQEAQLREREAAQRNGKKTGAKSNSNATHGSSQIEASSNSPIRKIDTHAIDRQLEALYSSNKGEYVQISAEHELGKDLEELSKRITKEDWHLLEFNGEKSSHEVAMSPNNNAYFMSSLIHQIDYTWVKHDTGFTVYFTPYKAEANGLPVQSPVAGKTATSSQQKHSTPQSAKPQSTPIQQQTPKVQPVVTNVAQEALQKATPLKESDHTAQVKTKEEIPKRTAKKIVLETAAAKKKRDEEAAENMLAVAGMDAPPKPEVKTDKGKIKKRKVTKKAPGTKTDKGGESSNAKQRRRPLHWAKKRTGEMVDGIARATPDMPIIFPGEDSGLGDAAANLFSSMPDMSAVVDAVGNIGGAALGVLGKPAHTAAFDNGYSTFLKS